MVFMSQGNKSTLHSTAHYRPRFQDTVYCINIVLHFQQDPVTQIRPHINAVNHARRHSMDVSMPVG